MGQQQLLFLVLGIVIVGLAVVVGLQAFGENQKESNADALVVDAIRISSDVQTWSLKPSVFGGGEGAFTGVTFPKLGYDLGASNAAATAYGNLNGSFTISEADGAVTIIGCNSGTGNRVVTIVDGLEPGDIETTQSNSDTCAAEA